MRTQCRFNSQAPECHGEGVTAMTCAEVKSSRAAMRSSRAVMKSLILKRSIMIDGQKTSVSLEDEFWQALKQIAAGLDMKMAELVHQISQQREYGNLSSALRLFVLEHYLSRAKAKRDTEGAQGEACSPS
jgi:predicted DNA-binding ribbon-helix-helix protein